MIIPKTIAYPLLLLPWILALAIFGWILIQRFPPSGMFVTTSMIDGKSAFINPFLPSERVSVPGLQPDGWVGQRITGDPTYFTTRVPGPYESAEIEIDFRSVRQPLLEFGIVRDAEGNDLDLTPMYLEQLQADVWRTVKNGYVRVGISDVRLDDPNSRGLAVWDATSSMPLLQDYGGYINETELSLRGAHDFYFVPVDGELDVAFGLQDSNREQGKSTVVSFRVFRGEEEIKRESLQTNSSKELKMGKVTEHRIRIASLSPGVYQIKFQSDDDVFIRSIKTKSKRWVVGPRLNFGDVVGYVAETYPARAWTNSRHIVAETFHKEGLQDVTLGPAKVEVARTHEAFRIDRTDYQIGAVELFAPNGDIRIIGDGWFALSRGAFFEPKPTRMTDATDLEVEKMVGVITDYKRPENLDNEWLRARFSYPLQGNEDRLRFVLSAPGVTARVGAVDIGRITVTYKRDPLSFRAWWNLIKMEAINAYKRL